MPEYDPVTKISIVPRGAAGGLTFFAPSEERLESGLYSRTYLENQVRMHCSARCLAKFQGLSLRQYLGFRSLERIVSHAVDVVLCCAPCVDVRGPGRPHCRGADLR